MLESGEECDDGNLVDGDGCNGICQLRLCMAPAASNCVMARRGSLRFRERGEGDKIKASLKLDLSDFGEDSALDDFGDPVFGTTRYDICVYGLVALPSGTLIVRRGFDQCGPKMQSCWKQIGGTGYRYSDKELLSSGVRSIDLVAGPMGKGRLKVAALRNKKSQRLPLMASPLQNATSAEVRVVSSDGRCLGISFPEVEADEDDFRARKQP